MLSLLLSTIETLKMWRSLVFVALLTTTFAFNFPGIPRDFTANDAVLAAISGKCFHDSFTTRNCVKALEISKITYRQCHKIN